MAEGREHAAAAGLFIGLAIVMTWPLGLHPGTAVTDQGDPLLNSWIMAWDAHRISSLSFSGFFDANIFFPYHRTLDYSEHLLPQAVVGLVPLELSGNPLLAYNLVLLLAMAGSAFGMYLLARRLTGSFAASAFAGVAFGFSLFMMSQLPHLQVLCAAGLPLSFYFLSRFCAGERVRDAALLGATIGLQMLANGYYAVLLPLFVGVALLHYALAARRCLDPAFIARVLLMVVVIGAIAGPFMYQYAAFRAEVGLSRGIDADATLASYLAAPTTNHVWGRATARLWRAERMYFPGLVTLVFGAVGIAASWRRLRDAMRQRTGRLRPRATVPLAWLFLAVIALVVFVILAVLTVGHYGTQIEVRAHDINDPLFVIAVLLAIWLAVDARLRARTAAGLAQHQEPLLVYGTMLVVAFLFSLGTLGPFLLLNRYVPGLDAVRAFPRIHVFFMLALAAFAALGMASLETRLSGRWRRTLVVGGSLALAVELACMPLRLQRVAPPGQGSSVYRWLAGQAGDDWGVVELPLVGGDDDIGREIQRVYASTGHWKRLVNGYSGYFPPLYDRLRERWNPAPVPADLGELRDLGLRFVVLHTAEMSAAQRDACERAVASVRPLPRLAFDSDSARVFELNGWRAWQRAPDSGAPARAMDRRGFKATASVFADEAPLALDGDRTTRWHTGPQRPGDFFQLDLGGPRTIEGVSLGLGPYTADYPRGYRVETSLDGQRWCEIARREDAELPLRALLRPKEVGVEIGFPPARCRYLRITNLGRHRDLWWSIAEIDVRRAE